MPNTLDEYCSPALPEEVLASRNRDQVPGRYEKSQRLIRDAAQTSRGNDDEDDRTFLRDLWALVKAYMRELSLAILVSQMWIWIIGNQIGNGVLAPEPQRKYPDSGISWSELKNRHPTVFIALLLAELVDRFDQPQPGGETLLKSYENALVAISEGVNQYTKSALIEDIDLDHEKNLLHQISDIRDELSMIKSVLSQQEEVWNEYTTHMWPTQAPGQQPGYHSDTEGSKATIDNLAKNIIPRQLSHTRAKFSKYNRRITKLQEDAERVERNILIKLDLKQKHATMREAHSAAMLSATVFGFTIITVVFAPLSFVVALFALPIDKFNAGKDGNNKDGVYSSNYIGKWSATAELVSIAITLMAMWAALRFVGIHTWGKKGLRDYVRQKADEIRTVESESKPGDVEQGDV
ncbi:hypothetical protein F4859DRAFT_528269 [Xylaria cf. heliscus]|nr:hypothetical protein F4859DRAFT_528269 [Xylaria cf. heliscus]